MFENLNGAVEITARVATLTNTTTAPTAGLMIRDTANVNGCSAYMSVNPSGALIFTTRSTIGAVSTAATGPTQTAPVWLRMNRKIVSGASTITAYYSTDGVTWTQVGSQTTSMGSNVYIGVNVSSGDALNTATATFDHLVAYSNVPQPASNLLVWLRADTGVTVTSGTVTSWADQSGNGNHATQATTAQQPTFSNSVSALNNEPAVNFSGSQGLGIPNSTALNPSQVTVFAVFSSTGTSTAELVDKDDGSNQGYKIDLASGTNARFFHNSTSANATIASGYNIVEGDFDQVSYRIYMNGILGQSTANTNTLASNTVPIGIGQTHNGGSTYLTGSIAEVLIYNTGLNDSDRHRVEAYLYQKYGVGTQPNAAAPILGTNQGTYNSTQSVLLSPGESGETVYYTTGAYVAGTITDPAWSGSTIRVPVTSATNISIPSTTTLNVVATEPGYTNSAITTATYTIDTASNFTRTGLIAWLRADVGVSTSGGTITSWADQSGNGNNAVQPTTTLQPTLTGSVSALNNMPAVTFNGASGLSIPDANSLDPTQITMIAVSNNTGTTQADLADKNNGSAYTLQVVTGTTAKFIHNSSTAVTGAFTPAGSYNVLEADFDQVAYRLLINGTVMSSVANTGALSANTVPIGIGEAHGGGTYMTGNIAELLIFNSKLSDTDRHRVEAYLYNKYHVGTQPPATTVTPSVPPGTYSVAQDVNLIPADPGETIYYTVDGSDPSDPLNTARITVSSPTTIHVSTTTQLKIQTVETGYVASSVTTTTYTIDPNSNFTRDGLLAWFRADVGVNVVSGKVPRWSDQSGNGNDAIQATVSKQPTLTSSVAALNNQPSLTCASQGFTIPHTAAFNPAQITIFAVANNTAGSTTASLVNNDNNNGYSLAVLYTGTQAAFYHNSNTATIGTIVNHSYNVLEGEFDLSSYRTYVNGILAQSTANTTPLTANTVDVGVGAYYNNSTPMTGNLAEVLIFNRGLSDSERHRVEAYLYNKYALGTQSVAPAPVLGLGQGTYSSALNVLLAPGEDGETLYYTTDGSDPTLVTNTGRIPVSTATNLNIAGTTTIKTVATEPLYANSAVKTVTYTIDPASTFPHAGLMAWLRADVGVNQSGGTITSWADQSGNGNDATQATTAMQPTLTSSISGLNNQPAVTFSGSQGLTIANTTALNSSQITVFTVYNDTGTGAARVVEKRSGTPGYSIEMASATAPTFYRNASTVAGTITSGTYNLVEGDFDQVSYRIYVNGTLAQSTSNTTAITTNTQNIGIGMDGGGGSYLTGHIAEVLIFNSGLNDQARQDVEAYLNAKYGFTGLTTAAAPILSSVVTGTSQTVTISPGATGETVYYTTDGTDPTVSLTRLSTTTTTNVTISTSAVAKALGTITGDAPSGIVATTEANPAPIGNDNQGGPSAPPGVYSVMPASGPIPVNAYTSDSMRKVIDLTTPAVGEIGLGWIRTNETREVSGTEVLGVGANWRHSFQWDLAYTTVNGVQELQVIYPDGTTNYFTQTSTNVWTSTSAVSDVITANGTGFLLTNAANQIYSFGQTTGGIYLLNSITDSRGNVTALSYDSQNKLIQVQEPGGRYLSINYTSYITEYQHIASGWITYASSYYISSVVTSDGRSVTYAYTPVEYTSGNYRFENQSLVTATYSGGDVATYTYAPLTTAGIPVLLTASDTRAKSTLSDITYSYYAGPSDALGAVQSTSAGTTTLVPVATVSLVSNNPQTPAVIFPDGALYNYAVSAGGLLANVQNSLGAIQSYGYQTSGGNWTTTSTNAKGKIVTLTSTVTGKLLSRTWPAVAPETVGPTEHWTYNTAGYLLTYQDAMGRMTQITRDPTTNLVTRVDYPDGAYETFTYNNYHEVLQHRRRSGGVEVFGYSTATGTAGLLLTEEDAEGNVTEFSYDIYYRVYAITDPKGYSTYFAYDDVGRTTAVIHPDTTYRSFTYDKSGNILTLTDERGKVWTYTYDKQSRLLTSVDPLSRTTTYAYGSGSNTKPTLITLPGGKKTAATYTKAWGYETATITAGYGTSDAAITTYGFDSLGNVTSVQDPLLHTTNIYYDERNRVSSIVDAASNTSTFTYDDVGNHTKTVNSDGTSLSYYDEMNRLYSNVDPKGQTTQMTYDNEGQLLAYVDPNNNIYQYTYDSDERQTSLQYPDSSTEYYTYDANGNLAAYKARDGKTETLSYDTRNRTTGTIWNDGVTPSTTMSYDSANRLTTLNNANSALGYTYDDDAEVLTETQNITGLGSKTVTYTYNTDTTLHTLTYPDATVLTYGYNNRQQTTSIHQTGITADVVDYAYDAAGNRITKSMANGTGSTLTYDAVERLTSIVDLTPYPISNTALQRFDYGYDAMSRRKYVKRDSALGDVYAYDSSGQVTGVQYNATNPDTTPTSPLRTVSYALDAAGNRSGSSAVIDSVNGTTSYTPNAVNQYTAVGGNSLGYDGRGNLASYSGWTYTYDALNRMIQATNGTITVMQAYDPMGRCVKRVDSGTTSYRVHDLGWNILSDYNSSGSLANRYVGGAGTDEIISKTDGSGNVVYYHFDAARNVTKLTSSTGVLLEQYTYDIYGAPTIKDGAGTTISSTAYGNQFLFTGREYVASLGLYDFRLRVYSPALGRFMQPDPIGHAGDGYNIHRYCGNDPVNFTDPTGLYTGWDDAAFIVGGAVAGIVGESINRAYGGEPISYWAAALGGAAGGEATLYGGPIAGGAAAGFATRAFQEIGEGKFNANKLAYDTAAGGLFGYAGGKTGEIFSRALGNTARNSISAITASTLTKLSNGTISNFTNQTLTKMATSTIIDQSQGAVIGQFELTYVNGQFQTNVGDTSDTSWGSGVESLNGDTPASSPTVPSGTLEDVIVGPAALEYLNNQNSFSVEAYDPSSSSQDYYYRDDEGDSWDY